ncbi:MAG TPA: hypothetical protein PLQ13_00945 [Candidatus Krumholzibacteria bacterium]|nr:hypothetical protein [Candidatus Krumholzibacteria bacterium]
MTHSIRSACGAACLCVLFAMPAVAWDEPAHWNTVGEVSWWAATDALFYRLRDADVSLDRSQERVDQAAAYARTLAYTGRVDGLELDAWLTLPADERARREKMAARELEFVARFRNRIADQAQRTRENLPSGWGLGVSDVTVVGDCLQKLRTAVGLDPANPYAWHLYAWFAQAVGDLDRAGRGLAGAERALAQVPADKLIALRQGVALDAAWLARERGDGAAASEALALARARGAAGFEATLLEGLLAADRGDQATAFRAADALRETRIRKYPLDYRISGSAPETVNVAVWKEAPSDFAERWIKALAWLRAGEPDMALKAFGGYRTADAYPFAARFWNDAGLIYELTGRVALAGIAWDQARICRPYAPYFPSRTITCNLGRLTGRSGRIPVTRAFGTFPTAGSRLAQGALLADAVGDTLLDDAGRGQAAADALDALAICEARGWYPAEAALLRGAVYERVGDRRSAVLEVETALTALRARGGTVDQALLDRLAQAAADRTGDGVLTFYGQSGAAQARWAAPVDPVAESAALREAYAAEPSDANRRALARSLVRGGDPAAGRLLVADRNDPQDLVLALEADRALGDPTLAVALAERLQAGDDPWSDAGLWTLAGFLCLDAERTDLGRLALERASELDPGNQGLRTQLKLMKGEL